MKSWGEIYREAARRIEIDEERYSCLAIARKSDGDAIRYQYDPAVCKYVSLFADDCGDLLARIQKIPGREQQNFRVLALCFMACIAEDEDAPQRKR